MMRSLILALLCCALLGPCFAFAAGEPQLPAVVSLELRRIVETYHVLDAVAEQVWPGWNNYRDFPFLLNYENGLRVLVGHPNPPAGFELVPGAKVAGKAVFADRRTVSALQLVPPLSAGGGPVPFGTLPDGKPVEIIEMRFRSVRAESPSTDQPAPPGENRRLGERQILIYIHELFHCFQHDHFKGSYGNLRYNPDANYAAYSAIEGVALKNAYAEPAAEKARDFLKDFLVARELKRRGSMTERQQNEESDEDLREGTATYSEVRTLELLRKGYKPLLTSAEDPYFGEFKDIDALLASYGKQLDEATENVLDARGKAYPYGCYQALLLQRFYPGWQVAFKEPTFLDKELRRRAGLVDSDFESAGERFKEHYSFEYVQARATRAIEERDNAYRLVSARTGMSYIVSFKKIQYYPAPQRKPVQLGLIRVFPEGLGDLRVNDVELSGLNGPAMIDQLYYVKAVDPNFKPGSKPYSIRFARQEPGGIHTNVEITTPLFKLTAPKVKISETKNRVKIQVLSRVKET